MYTEVSDIFYGSDRKQYEEIQKDDKSFGISYYLEPLSRESFDELFITELNGQKHCFAKTRGYEFHVTKNTEVEMRVGSDKKVFIQRNFDPQTKTSTRYSLSQGKNEIVELSFDMEYYLEDGTKQGCSFMVQLPAKESFWTGLSCGARSIDSIIDYFIQHTTPEKSNDLISTFGVQIGMDSLEISSENCGNWAKYDKSDRRQQISLVRTFKGTIAEQFLQVLRIKSPNFLNTKNHSAFMLFRRLEPTLRNYVDNELSIRYGDNLDALLKSTKLQKDTELKND